MNNIEIDEIDSVVQGVIKFDKKNKTLKSNFNSKQWEIYLHKLHIKLAKEMTSELINVSTNLKWLSEILPELFVLLENCIDVHQVINIKHLYLYEVKLIYLIK